MPFLDRGVVQVAASRVRVVESLLPPLEAVMALYAGESAGAVTQVMTAADVSR